MMRSMVDLVQTHCTVKRGMILFIQTVIIVQMIIIR